MNIKKGNGETGHAANNNNPDERDKRRGFIFFTKPV
jgi:hypothetical protein